MAGSIRIGVVGCGYWGPNHIRVFSSLGRLGAKMTAAADRSEERLRHVADLYPWLRIDTEAETILRDPDLDAVVIATPVHTHYPFARMALEAGKHVLVEKPFVTEVERYTEWHKRRLETLPGITGLWQVSGRNALSFEEMVRLDIQYIETWSLEQDMKILLKTVPALLFGRAY